jgi:hypothetical protein
MPLNLPVDWAYVCTAIEGDRTFSIIWGLTTGAICLLIAVPTLWWTLPGHERWVFPRAVDPRRQWQMYYGVYTMAMGFTNVLCRMIPHGLLPWVHPAFFLVTIILTVTLGTRIAYLAIFGSRYTAVAGSAA